MRIVEVEAYAGADDPGQPRLRAGAPSATPPCSGRPATSTCTSPTACTGAPTWCAADPGCPPPCCCGQARRCAGLDQMRLARGAGRSVARRDRDLGSGPGPVGPGPGDRPGPGRRRPGPGPLRDPDRRRRGGATRSTRPQRAHRDPPGHRSTVALVRSRRPEPVPAADPPTRLIGGPTDGAGSELRAAGPGRSPVGPERLAGRDPGQLASYAPPDAEQAATLDRMVEFVDRHPDALWRTCCGGPSDRLGPGGGPRGRPRPHALPSQGPALAPARRPRRRRRQPGRRGSPGGRGGVRHRRAGGARPADRSGHPPGGVRRRATAPAPRCPVPGGGPGRRPAWWATTSPRPCAGSPPTSSAPSTSTPAPSAWPIGGCPSLDCSSRRWVAS